MSVPGKKWEYLEVKTNKFASGSHMKGRSGTVSGISKADRTIQLHVTGGQPKDLYIVTKQKLSDRDVVTIPSGAHYQFKNEGPSNYVITFK